MNNNPLFSICIPTYNRPHLLSVLLDRLFLQIHDTDRVEIVISNNNPDDSQTVAMLSAYLKKHKNIQYHHHPHVYRFHNTIQATRHAKGSYIISLADDDSLTEYALSYLEEIVKKTDFDILFHKPVFVESIDVPIIKSLNEFTLFHGIEQYISYLSFHEKQYKNVISFFSFQSAFVVKKSYRHDALDRIDRTPYATNEFPHEFPAYFDLKDKTIVVPKSTIGIGRILNESYPGSTALIEDLHEVMDYIEIQNDLDHHKERKTLKKICLNGRARTIWLGILLQKLHINYKKNIFLKYLYFLYKKFLQ